MAVEARGTRPGERDHRDVSLARRLLIIQVTAVAVWAVGVALVISQLAGDGPVYEYWLEGTTSAFVIMPVAFLLGRRRPHHHVSWLFTVFLCVGALQLCSGAIIESVPGLSPPIVGTL